MSDFWDWVDMNVINQTDNDGPITPDEWNLLRTIARMLQKLKAESPQSFHPREILNEKLTEITGSGRAKSILNRLRRGKKVTFQYVPNSSETFLPSVPIQRDENLLNNLREDLLINILTQFLFTEDLARLDTAASSTVFRSYLLQCISRPDVTFDGSKNNLLRCTSSNSEEPDSTVDWSGYVNWLIKRNIAVRSLCCHSMVVTSSTLRILLSSMASHQMGLSEFALVNFDEINNEHMTGYSDNDILFIATQFPGIKTIHLCLSLYITDAALSSLGTHCNQLQNFKLELLDENNGLVTDQGIIIFSLLASKLLSLRIDMPYEFEMQQSTIRAVTANCCQLREISLQNRLIGGDAIAAILQNCPSLTKLVFMGALMEDEGLKLINKYPSLEYLEFNDCYTDSDDLSIGLVEVLITAFPKLKTLHTTGPYPRLSDRLVELLSSDLTNLSYDGECDDVIISKLVKKCPNLSYIYLSSNKITDTAVFALVQHCPLLSELSLMIEDHCKGITKASLEILYTDCQNLKKLYIRSCDITVADLRDVNMKFQSRQLSPIS